VHATSRSHIESWEWTCSKHRTRWSLTQNSLNTTRIWPNIV
jgi:hypothetical protein